MLLLAAAAVGCYISSGGMGLTCPRDCVLREVLGCMLVLLVVQHLTLQPSLPLAASQYVGWDGMGLMRVLLLHR